MKGLKRELGQACKIRLNDDESIQRLYKKYKEETKDNSSPECAQMLMNIACNNCNTDIVSKVLFDTPQEKRTESMYTILIKGYCINKNIFGALDILRVMLSHKCNPHIRTFIPIFEYDKLEYKFYKECIDIIVDASLIPTIEIFYLIFKHRYDYRTKTLLEILSNYHHEVTENIARSFKSTKCDIEKEIVQRQDILPSQRDILIQCLRFEGVEILEKFIRNKKVDAIVDGSNVAMHNNSAFNFKKVYKLVSKLKNTLEDDIVIIFHIGRKKAVDKYIAENKISLPDKVHIWYSKVNQDDDISWMYATCFANCKCVTDDKLRDHLYYRFSKHLPEHVFDRFIENHIVNFTFHVKKNTWNVEISFPNRFGNRTIIDEKNDMIYFPVKRDENVEWWKWHRKV